MSTTTSCRTRTSTCRRCRDGLDDKTDEALARQSLVEGDAYLTMSYWLQQNLTPEEIGEVIQASNDPTAQQALNRIPTDRPGPDHLLCHPGHAVSSRACSSAVAGRRSTADFGDPPQSTEQILHPEKYAAREAPIAVDLAADLREAQWARAGRP
jgi:hypothetical protein